MGRTRAVPASTDVYGLGEGPFWDDDTARLLWVDIDAGTVLEASLDGDRIGPVTRSALDTTVGAVVPAPHDGLLAAGHTELLVVDRARRITSRRAVLPAGSGRRLNDGACDPAGRFLVGSMSLGSPTGSEVLIRLEQDGTLTTLDDDLGLSNGLAWSPDGSLLYSVDTTGRVVWRRPYDARTGEVGARHAHLRLDDAMPDGACTDADGNLWVALWGRGEVRCLSPRGTLLHTVEVPAPNTTSVAFVGPGLATLLITTARLGLDADRLREAPDSGRLFTCAAPTSGLPAVPWSGVAVGDGASEPGAGEQASTDGPIR